MGNLSTEVGTEALCSYICELEEDCRQLRRENAELQDEIKHLLVKRQYTEDENAKLRELCIRMRTYMGGVVEECDEAMIKLGIEVDI